MTGSDWVPDARRALISAQRAGGGWGYRRSAPSCAEPTALGGLALLASGAGGESSAAARAAADRLASLQNPDGSVGVSEAVPAPGWATPYALLLWDALGVHPEPARSATRWLLVEKGRTVSRDDDPNRVAGHDTTIVGWPWVGDTHSWLEPTAAAVLGLARRGLADHPRVREGIRLIRDRALASGGWNYGNKAVFGRPLRPQPGPTGLALLALADGSPADETVSGALGYLARALPETRAPQSLGWGVLGLRAWGSLPEASEAWLAEAFARVSGRDDAPPRLAALLLAAGGGALALVGRRRSIPQVGTRP